MSFTAIMVWFVTAGLAISLVDGPLPLVALVAAVLAAYAHSRAKRWI